MRSPTRWQSWIVLCWTFFVWGCSPPEDGVPEAQRLVDVFTPEMVAGTAPAGPPPARTEWRFDGGGDGLKGWEASAGVAGLRIEDGRLVGEGTEGFPVLRLRRSEGLDDTDPLSEVRVRMRSSAGKNLGFHFIGAEERGMDQVHLSGQIAFRLTRTPLVPGEMRDYVVKPTVALRSADIHQLLFQPADAPGARFEIESIRLVFRREVLAEKASGIGWEGVSDTYRETVAARAPEVVSWPLHLPARPRLELALASLDDRPVTFQVTADGVAQPLLKRTLTTSMRWEEVAVDLDELAGRDVTLRLAVTADDPGTLGFWGSPVVRNRVDPAARYGAAASNGRPGPPQGVIFILADTLRRDHLSVYGHDRETSPLIDRLASQGALFQDTLAQGTWTKVSTASLFTSLYPSTVGVFDLPDRVPSSATTLAEVYRRAGFATLGFSSVSFTGKQSNLHQGYETLKETVSFDFNKTARKYVDRLLPWIEDHRNERFFVRLHFFDPHSPFEPAAPYDAMWTEPSSHRKLKEKVVPTIVNPARKALQLPSRQEVLDAVGDVDAYVAGEMGWYDGSIRAMDRELSRLFERLGELGLDEKTLVVFTADHGEEFLEHGRMFHGQSVYGELTNVPLIFRYPGVVPEGARIDETVQLLDVMPTLLDLSGLEIPRGVQGQSLLPLLARAAGPSWHNANGESWRPRPAISERPPIANATEPFDAASSTAIVYDGWKLVVHREPREGVPERELFRHREDPLDAHDIAAEHPDVVERLEAMLDAWRREAEAARLPGDDEAQAEMSPEEIHRLRSLGYLK